VKKIMVKIGAGTHLTKDDFLHLFKEISKSAMLANAEVSISETKEEGLILESLEVEK